MNKKKALQRHVVNGNVEKVQRILEDRGKFSLPLWCRDLTGYLGKMLHKTSNVDISKLLLFHGAQVDARNRKGETPLMTAVRRTGNVDYVSVLLEHGADVNARNEIGQTPLICSVLNCHYSLAKVKALLRHGADVNARGKDDYTALMVTVSCRDQQIKYLKDENKVLQILLYEVMKGDDTCHYFCRLDREMLGCQASIVKELLEHGANPNDSHNQLGTALHMALRNPNLNYDSINYLLINDAFPNSSSNIFRDSPLHAAASNKYMTVNILNRLFEQGAFIDAKNFEGKTALHVAVEKHDNIEVIRTLINVGANVNATNRYKNTPLHLAVKRSCCVVRELLKVPWVDVEARNQDRDTPRMLLAAECNCNESLVRQLVAAGANVKATNMFLETPLHKALQRGDWNLDPLVLYDPAEVSRHLSWRAMAEYLQRSMHHVDLEKFSNLIHMGRLKIEDPFMRSQGYALRLKIIKELVKCGSNVFSSDLNGKTPIMLATDHFEMQSDTKYCVKALIKYSILHLFHGRNWHSDFMEPWEDLEQHPVTPQFTEECFKEINYMKEIKVTEDISVHDYLNKENLPEEKRSIIDANINKISDMIVKMVADKNYVLYKDALWESVSQTYWVEKFVKFNLCAKVKSDIQKFDGKEVILDSYSMQVLAEYIPRADLAKFVLSFADSNFSADEPILLLRSEHFPIPRNCCAKHKIRCLDKAKCGKS